MTRRSEDAIPGDPAASGSAHRACSGDDQLVGFATGVAGGFWEPRQEGAS